LAINFSSLGIILYFNNEFIYYREIIMAWKKSRDISLNYCFT